MGNFLKGVSVHVIAFLSVALRTDTVKEAFNFSTLLPPFAMFNGSISK
jgi:hypothetical protein